MYMVVHHLSLILHEGGLSLQECLYTLLQFTEFFLIFSPLMSFGKKKRTVDWENLLEDWDSEYYWKNWAGRIVWAPREIRLISQSRIVSL